MRMKCVSTENLYYRSFLIAWGLFKMALSENTLQSDGFLGGRLVTLSLFFGSFKQGQGKASHAPHRSDPRAFVGPLVSLPYTVL